MISWALSCAAQDAAVTNSARQIYFVPLGEFRSVSVTQLAGQFQQRLKVSVHVMPALSLNPTVVDSERRQLIAQRLIELMKSRYARWASHPAAILIGLTEGDMYIQGFPWRFAFSFREGERLAVVSGARMDPVRYGEASDSALLHTRLRKMPLKILGLEELDFVTENF